MSHIKEDWLAVFITFLNCLFFLQFENFQEWCVGQITMPDNFKQILNSSAPTAKSTKPGLQVICLGLSRTGTSSLKAALTILKGRTFHAMDFLNQINDEVENTTTQNQLIFLCF